MILDSIQFQVTSKISSIHAAMIGDICLMLVLIFYGPISGIPVNFINMNWLYFCFLITLADIGLAFGVVSSFSRIQEASIDMNYVQDINTFLFLSSLWSTFFFSSNFHGYTFAGIYVDFFGLRNASAIFFTFVAIDLIMNVFDFISYIKDRTGYNSIKWIND